MTARAITIADLVAFDGEPKILDLRLAEGLGFVRARDIRKLVERNLSELEQYGEVCATVAQTSPRGGRPSIEYWLSMEQALTVSVLSNASNAPEVRRLLIAVFMAWWRGDLEARKPAIDDPLPVDRRQALAEVREARLIFGPRAARALWNQSPYLPRVPEMDLVTSSGGDEGPECLGHLLGFMVDEDMRSVADLLQSGEAGPLERIGLKPVDGGVWLDPSKPEMKALWKRTRWRDGLWISHLRRLPGVTGNHPRMSIGGHQCRPLWFPAALFVA